MIHMDSRKVSGTPRSYAMRQSWQSETACAKFHLKHLESSLKQFSFMKFKWFKVYGSFALKMILGNWEKWTKNKIGVKT